MAVADRGREAMASHRPYRPGLGIDAALAEIEKNKGTHYDNTVADGLSEIISRKKGISLNKMEKPTHRKNIFHMANSI